MYIGSTGSSNCVAQHVDVDAPDLGQPVDATSDCLTRPPMLAVAQATDHVTGPVGAAGTGWS
jgi:hypothetical protein